MTASYQIATLPSEDQVQTPEQKIMSWLLRKNKLNTETTILINKTQNDDWQTVASLCGYQEEDFASLGAELPLTASEIDYFRRNHRDVDHFIARDFLIAPQGLPSPLSELYELYCHRARVDVEAAFFIAQATGSVRVARLVADLLAVGGFSNAMENVSHMTMTYAVSAAFDTSDLIDRANQEALRRLSLPVDHPAHLLTLSPDEIGLLAANVVDRHLLSSSDFLQKANLLAEARQDVNRLPKHKQFATSIGERDLPMDMPWVSRLCAAFAHVFEGWVVGIPEIAALMNQKVEISYQ